MLPAKTLSGLRRHTFSRDCLGVMKTVTEPATMEHGLRADSAVDDGGESIRQIVSFRLADEEYGVDIMHVQEVILIGQITEMPQVPKYVRGLINLRGHVIPILDLRTRFDLVCGEETELSRIVVMNVSGKTVGIVVDAVDEVLRVRESQVEAAPSGLFGVGDQYVNGLVKLESKLLILLDIRQIVERETSLPKNGTAA